MKNYDHFLGKMVCVTLKDGHGVSGVFVGEEKDHYLIDHKVVTGRYTKNYVRKIELVNGDDE